MQILGLDLLYIIAVGLAWIIGSVVMYIFVLRPLFKRWVKNTITSMLSDPDDEVVAAMGELVTRMVPMAWNWFLTAEIKTGKKVQTEDGTEVDEITTPYQSLLQATAKAIYSKFVSGKGGMMKGANALAEGLVSPEGAPFMAMLGPQKGESAAMFQLKQMILPYIDQIIKSKMKDIVSGGASEKW